MGNYARAKTIKVTLDNKEYTYTLEDTMKAQFLDIDYTHNTVSTPISAKIEVLDYYPGNQTNEVYISDILFGITQSFSAGR